jgi:hypothetical protein
MGLNDSNGWRQSEQWRMERHCVGPKRFSSVVRDEPQ